MASEESNGEGAREAGCAGPPLVLTVPSELRFLSVARAFVESLCLAHQLDTDDASAIVLALHEAVSNVMRHAHRDRPEALVHIHCHFEPDRLEIDILDDGAPFDLGAVPLLDPAELRIGGRGVFLMRALMDEVSCRPRAAGGNVLRLVKRWRSASRLSHCG
jgi:serine/threonine-protein kinase RsbW